MDATLIRKAFAKLGCSVEPGKKHKKVRFVVGNVFIGQTTLPQNPAKSLNGHWVSQICKAVMADSASELQALGGCHRSKDDHLAKLKKLDVIQ